MRLNGPKAAGKKITLNVNFTDLKKEYGLTVENGVLNYSPGPIPNANASLQLTKATIEPDSDGEPQARRRRQIQRSHD